MMKLITAKEAYALSSYARVSNNIIAKANKEITAAAKTGATNVSLAINRPIVEVDKVVEQLRDAGYEVYYSSVADNFSIIKIWWN